VTPLLHAGVAKSRGVAAALEKNATRERERDRRVVFRVEHVCGARAPAVLLLNNNLANSAAKRR
jgi:hypothetical protein